MEHSVQDEKLQVGLRVTYVQWHAGRCSSIGHIEAESASFKEGERERARNGGLFRKRSTKLKKTKRIKARARVGCNESVMLKFNQVQGSPLGVTPSGIGKKCHCKQEVPYCVPVTKHFHYKNGQLGNQESVTVTSVTVSGEP